MTTAEETEGAEQLARDNKTPVEADSSGGELKHAAKYYPGSRALQLLGKVRFASHGGYIQEVSASKVFLVLNYGNHLENWKNYRRDTLTALVDDELVTLTADDGSHGQPIQATEKGRALWQEKSNW